LFLDFDSSIKFANANWFAMSKKADDAASLPLAERSRILQFFRIPLIVGHMSIRFVIGSALGVLIGGVFTVGFLFAAGRIVLVVGAITAIIFPHVKTTPGYGDLPIPLIFLDDNYAALWVIGSAVIGTMYIMGLSFYWVGRRSKEAAIEGAEFPTSRLSIGLGRIDGYLVCHFFGFWTTTVAFFCSFCITTLIWKLCTPDIYVGGLGTSTYDIPLLASDLFLQSLAFGIMEHFDFHLTQVLGAAPIIINKDNWFFLGYSFAFRLYFTIFFLKTIFDMLDTVRTARSIRLAPPKYDRI
jgi:hypothetical protein